MRKIILLIVILNLSCDGIGQDKKDSKKVSFDEVFRFNGVRGDSLKFKSRKKTYQTYLTLEKDTILLSVQEYKFFDNKRDTIIKSNQNVAKKITLLDSVFIVKYSGELFLIKRDKNKYNFIEKIKVEYEIFYDDYGEAHEEYFPASNIKHFKDNEYIVIYPYEGIFKIGVFEITENGITKKFLSKGCLIYDEWSEFDFLEIKEGKVFVNYLKVWDGEEVGQIELKYENGEYSLDFSQCD